MRRRRCIELKVAVERIRAARRAIDRAGGDTLLVGRAECFLVGHAGSQLDDREAQGLRGRRRGLPVRAGDSRRSSTSAPWSQPVHPKPVNLLMSAPGGLTLRQIAELGVRRVSVGGALARAAWGGFMRAAREIAERGTFKGLANAASGQELNALFSDL